MNSRTFVFAPPQKIFYKHAACCIFKNNIGNKSYMRWSLLFLEWYIYISSSVFISFDANFFSQHQANHWMQQSKRGSLESTASVSKRHHFKFRGSRRVTFPTLFIYIMLSYFMWKARKRKKPNWFILEINWLFTLGCVFQWLLGDVPALPLITTWPWIMTQMTCHSGQCPQHPIHDTCWI